MEKTFTVSADTVIEWLTKHGSDVKVPWLAGALLFVRQFAGKKIEVTVRAVDR